MGVEDRQKVKKKPPEIIILERPRALAK